MFQFIILLITSYLLKSANNLRQLALQMDEGLGSEVEKFAKEMHEQGNTNQTLSTTIDSPSLKDGNHKHSCDEDDEDDDDEQEDDVDEEETADHVDDDSINLPSEKDHEGIH